MIIGDPYKFAIMCERVKQWNTSLDENNGWFSLIIDGEQYPSKIANFMVYVCLIELYESLESIPVEENIYEMKASDAFRALYELVYPSDYEIDNDYRYELSPTELIDENAFAFAVKSGENVKIISANLEYDYETSKHIFDDNAVKEIVLKQNEVIQILKKIDEVIKSLKAKNAYDG